MYSRGFKAQVLGGMTASIARTTATPLSKQPVQQLHMTAIDTITAKIGQKDKIRWPKNSFEAMEPKFQVNRTKIRNL